jgi:hypothetical protein
MASRDEMREAKKAAGLCLHDGCGNKALLTPVLYYCEKHLPEDPRLTRRRGKKRTPSN